jgi:cytosine/adenosine deaminase-related metal-dependent hydrolase
MDDVTGFSNAHRQLLIRGARCSLGPTESIRASIRMANGRITHLLSELSSMPVIGSACTEIDLTGFLVMPGLVNAHDHLQFALYPRLGDPPYLNYIEWGEDIHRKFPKVIARHRSVPREVRLWWGGIRNLLCGVTTVCHHNELWPELRRQEFPVRVVQRYGWAHSFALGGELRRARSATPEGCAFIMHAGEGVDERAGEEVFSLDQLGLLDGNAVLVHGLALNDAGIAMMRQRGVSLIVCPSSNKFLFEKLPDMGLLSALENIALGNDSPLTAAGDLLDEIRYAIRHCGVPPDMAYRMVTDCPASILRLGDARGSLSENGAGDLIAVRDTNQEPANTLSKLSMADVELVLLRGRVQLASESILKRLSPLSKRGLQPLWINGVVRWLCGPVKEFLERAEEALGKGQVCLGGNPVRIPS